MGEPKTLTPQEYDRLVKLVAHGDLSDDVRGRAYDSLVETERAAGITSGVTEVGRGELVDMDEAALPTWAKIQPAKPAPAGPPKPRAGDERFDDPGGNPSERMATGRGIDAPLESRITKSEAMLHAAGQGLTMGLADEMLGPDARARKDAAYRQYPNLTLGTELGAGLATAAIPGKAVAATAKGTGMAARGAQALMRPAATAGRQLVKNMAKGTAQAVTEGALQAAGHADGRDVAEEVKASVPMSLAAGLGGPLLGAIPGGLRRWVKNDSDIGAMVQNVEAQGGKTSVLNQMDPPPGMTLKPEMRGGRTRPPGEVAAYDAAQVLHPEMGRIQAAGKAARKADAEAVYAKTGDERAPMTNVYKTVVDSIRKREYLPFAEDADFRKALPKLVDVSAEKPLSGDMFVVSATELADLGIPAPKAPGVKPPPSLGGAREIDLSGPASVATKEAAPEFYYLTPKSLTAKEFDDAIGVVDDKWSPAKVAAGTADAKYRAVSAAFRKDRESSFGDVGKEWAAMKDRHHRAIGEAEAMNVGAGLPKDAKIDPLDPTQHATLEQTARSFPGSPHQTNLRSSLGDSLAGPALDKVATTHDVLELRKRGSSSLGASLVAPRSPGWRELIMLRGDAAASNVAKATPQQATTLGGLSAFRGAGLAKRNQDEDPRKGRK